MVVNDRTFYVFSAIHTFVEFVDCFLVVDSHS